MEVHEKVLGYEPDEKTTMLLVDFADYGNAPPPPSRQMVMVQVAPIIPNFETFAPAERMYSLMNHEMVHVVTTDQPAPAENRYRRLFGGKVLPVAEHPGIGLLPLPYRPAGRQPALVPRGHRRIHGDMDGRGARAGAGRLRRDDVSFDG